MENEEATIKKMQLGGRGANYTKSTSTWMSQ